jgi:hypothetical protein
LVGQRIEVNEANNLRVEDPFFRVVSLIVDLVCHCSQRLLHSGLPVRFHQILQIPAVGRTGVRDICEVLINVDAGTIEVYHTMVG